MGENIFIYRFVDFIHVISVVGNCSGVICAFFKNTSDLSDYYEDGNMLLSPKLILLVLSCNWV